MNFFRKLLSKPLPVLRLQVNSPSSPPYGKSSSTVVHTFIGLGRSCLPRMLCSICVQLPNEIIN